MINMSTETLATPDIQKPTVEEQINNADAVYRKNRELLDVIGTKNAKIKEYEAQQESLRIKKLEEEGQYKTLLEEKEKKIIEYEKEMVVKKSYDGFFTEQYETIKKELPENVLPLLENYPGTLTDKIKYATELLGLLKAQSASTVIPPQSSPGADRPSGQKVVDIDMKDYLGRDRVKNLIDLEGRDPAMYAEVIKRLNQIK
jgi:hypothetical protein